MIAYREVTPDNSPQKTGFKEISDWFELFEKDEKGMVY